MKQPIRRFVFNRLALMFSTMIILLTLLSAGYLYRINDSFYHSKYQEKIENYEWVLKEWIDSGHQELDYLEENFFPKKNVPLTEQHFVLKRLHDTKVNRFDYIFMATPDGQYITSKNLQSKTIADRVYFQHAIKGESYTSEMIVSRLTNNEMFVLTSPLYDEYQRLIGTFSGAIEVSNMSSQLKDFAVEDPNLEVYIVDYKGKIGAIMSASGSQEERTLIGQDIGTVLKSQQILLGASGDFKQDGSEIFYREIEGSNGWRVVFKVGAMAKFEGLFIQFVLILLVSVLLLFMVYQFSRRFSKAIVSPVYELIASFEDLTKGNLSDEKPEFQILEMDKIFHEFEQLSVKLYDLTYKDPLTELNNLTYFRNYLQGRLHQDLDALVQNAMLVFVEIDHFKVINDTFGFSGGDAVIKHIGDWLREEAGVEHPSKMNGDEFAFIIEDEMGILKAYELCGALNDNLKNGVCYNGSKIIVSVSFGLTHFYEDQLEADLYFQNAYIALNEAKLSGSGSLEVYNQRLKSTVTRKVLLEMEMRSALENREMYPVYQPIIGLDGIEICGFEALIRWESPKLGFVSPNEFIPIAENSKFIVQIGKWMVERTLEDLNTLKKVHGESIYLSLNASSIEFETEGFAQMIIDSAKKFGHEPKDIVIELTERVMMTDKPVVDQNIKKLIEHSFQLSLDDFGTGYSSLSYLLKYPFSIVKIDRAFVANNHTRSAQELLEVMRLIAEKYQLKTVAEGVETTEQASRMAEIGFNYGQGYYYGRPKRLNDL